MRQADALMRRRRFVAGEPESPTVSEAEIPVLTEEVGQVADSPPTLVNGPSIEEIRASVMDEFAQALRELRLPLHDLVELWLAQRAPELLDEEIRSVRTRFSARLLSAARAELMPQLARLMDEITAPSTSHPRR